jgi:REP element-mobilizing transposase RayT
MARPLRIEFAGALYHVTSRGNERRPIFRSDRDRRMFLTLLEQAARRFRWSITAYILMTNHFHLVIQTPDPNLSRGMQWLNGTYAAWFNHRHQRTGHLFQGRFRAFLVEKEAYFAELLRYVVLNPVRAKMVERPEDYRWSSYRATAGLEAAPAWLDVASALDWLTVDPAAAKTAYREFVMEKLGGEDRLWDKVTHAMYLGSEQWTKRMRELVESRPRSTDHPKPQRAVGRPDLRTIVETVAVIGSTSQEAVRSVRGGPLRRLIAWIGWHEGLITLRSIAAALRLRSEGYVSNLIRRCDRELAGDSRLLANLDATLTILRA